MLVLVTMSAGQLDRVRVMRWFEVTARERLEKCRMRLTGERTHKKRSVTELMQTDRMTDELGFVIAR